MAPARVGTAGWSIPARFAADVATPGSHLERYSRAFACAEINSSFYRPHRVSTWEKWAASVPDGFLFSVKAPRTMTHEAKLEGVSDLLGPFLAQARLLGPKLGPLLFQLPPKLAFNHAVAAGFLELLRDLHSAAVVFEPRHASWFTEEADALFQRFAIARAAADPTRIPEAAAPGGWSGLVYYRLHGSPRVYYSEYGAEYLQSLASRIERQRQTSEVWCIFDNTASGAALGDAQTLTRLLLQPQLTAKG